MVYIIPANVIVRNYLLKYPYTYWEGAQQGAGSKQTCCIVCWQSIESIMKRLANATKQKPLTARGFGNVNDR